MNLNDLEIYRISMQLSDEIWKYVTEWDYFKRKTIGSQLVEAADSVSVNISEGCGRFHYKDSLQFFYYSRGSLFETKTWLVKVKTRELLPEPVIDSLIERYEKLGVKLNNFITASKKTIQSQKPGAEPKS